MSSRPLPRRMRLRRQSAAGAAGDVDAHYRALSGARSREKKARREIISSLRESNSWSSSVNGADGGDGGDVAAPLLGLSIEDPQGNVSTPPGASPLLDFKNGTPALLKCFR